MTVTAPAPAAQRSTSVHADAWPAFTVHTDDDVVVAAVALTRLVTWCGTPSVHNSAAATPGTGGRSAATERASVVVARVLDVEWRSDLRMHVVIDADLRHCRPITGDTRVIGRRATVHLSSAVLRRGAAADDAFSTYLPSDVVVGDLIVIPCAGATLLHEVKLA